ncbi:MAG: PASTA domain protein [Planctomycetes bacterium ADurb.Bin401]|nr:MAG: PASTA domain protein [Planctomycetes bacterium ADurb.Bin401]
MKKSLIVILCGIAAPFTFASTPWVLIPDIVGMTLPQAEQTLVLGGLITGTISYEFDNIVAKDEIILQNPAAGTGLPAGSSIDVIISLGTNYGGGDGSAGNPFQIWTAEQMNTIGLYTEHWNKCFKLMTDIDMSAYTDIQYNIIGHQTSKFTGTFDGNKHVIRNLTYENKNTNLIYSVGLFGYTNGSTIKDLGIEDIYFYVHSFYVGGLAGIQENSNNINCYTTGSMILFSSYNFSIGAGGLVGSNVQCTNENCFSDCSLDLFHHGEVYAGGLIGMQGYNSFIKNCCSRGSVCSIAFDKGGCGNHAGGLFGYAQGNIQKCYSASQVYAYGGLTVYQGGFAARTDGPISSCFWDVNSSGLTNAIAYGYSSTFPVGKTTAEMNTHSTFYYGEWDLVGETVNGSDDIWRMCADGRDYPRLWYEFAKGDLVCPDGVDLEDLYILASQWLCKKLDYDYYRYDHKHTVNFLDFNVFADSWTYHKSELASFFNEWLQYDAYNGNIAGDNIVNTIDFAALAENWMR